MKVLVAGWFSFEEMGATAGDLMVRDVICRWLDEADVRYSVAHAAPFPGGIRWEEADPSDFDAVVFACGPFGNGPPVTDFLAHFAGCSLVGVNLSMLQSLQEWDPFEVLLERDSSRTSRADLSFLAESHIVPVVGIILVHHQSEYEGSRHDEVGSAIDRLRSTREMAAVHIDTRLDRNATGLRSASEVETLIARMDVVVTTRLHGVVLALKHGVPAIAIDPVSGGAKIARQAETVGWPVLFTPETLSDAALADAFEYCLSDAAREKAWSCAGGALRSLQDLRSEFLAGLVGIGG